MSNTKADGDLPGRVKALEDRVRLLEDALSGGEKAAAPSAGPSDALPNSLARSLRAMQQLGEADATGVSTKTLRNRSVETIYLNQLVRLGYLTRSRAGKKVMFRLARVY